MLEIQFQSTVLASRSSAALDRMSSGVLERDGETNGSKAWSMKLQRNRLAGSFGGNTKVLVHGPEAKEAEKLELVIKSRRIEQILAQRKGQEYYVNEVAPLPLNPAKFAPGAVFHVLVLGVPGCGGNSLAGRYLGEKLVDGTGSRVVAYGDRHATVFLHLFHSIENVKETSIKRVSGVVIVCDVDVTQTSSLKRALQFRRDLESMRVAKEPLKKLFCVLVANKNDCGVAKKLSEKKIQDLCEQENVDFDRFFLASALTGLNVDNVFNSVIDFAASQPMERKSSSASRRSTVRPSSCVIC